MSFRKPFDYNLGRDRHAILRSTGPKTITLPTYNSPVYILLYTLPRMMMIVTALKGIKHETIPYIPDNIYDSKCFQRVVYLIPFFCSKWHRAVSTTAY